MTLRAVLLMLRRRWLTVALCAFGVGAGALALTTTQEKKYESSASILFRPGAVERGLFDSPSSKPADVERAAATNIEFGRLDAIAERAAGRLRKFGVSGRTVASSVDLSAHGDSDVASIIATTDDPALSRRVANAFAEEYIAFRRRVDRGSVRDSQRLLTRRLRRLTPRQRAAGEGRRLRRAAQELEVLGALRTGSAELVQRARAKYDAVVPRPKRNTAVGMMLGLLLGITMAFLVELRDRRLNDEADVERVLGLPLLARIPRPSAVQGAGAGARGHLSSPSTEAFRMLRVSLRYLDSGPPHSLLVTSPAQGEGRSTVSWNIALTEAQAGSEVLLIEADLRTGVLAEQLELPGDRGLSLLLDGSASIDQSTLPVRTSNARLDVIPSGPTPRNPAALVESARMSSVLESAQARYEFVVVDTPPVSSVPDALPLVNQVSGVIVVARLGHSTSDSARELRDRLERLGAPVLGAVVNDAGRMR